MFTQSSLRRGIEHFPVGPKDRIHRCYLCGERGIRPSSSIKDLLNCQAQLSRSTPKVQSAALKILRVPEDLEKVPRITA